MYGYLMDVIRYWRQSFPEIPPFMALVGLFLLINLILYYTTKSKGYLIAMGAGALYFVPWFLRH